jgi:prephenate dehydrogenase
MAGYIETKDSQHIYSFFDNARKYRNSVPERTTGIIRPNHEVYVDIPDEPGALAAVINSISDKDINLKNVGITHNREDTEGVLKICFYNSEDAATAADILRSLQYNVYER